jgi:ABC-type phosphate/phosphonate transport system substrate-binding protein
MNKQMVLWHAAAEKMLITSSKALKPNKLKERHMKGLTWMKQTKLFVVGLLAVLISVTGAMAEGTITEFRIGILGGENASDRLRSNECVRAQA